MEILKHFEQIISESPNILEIGAYDGEDSRLMLEILGERKFEYHLFEPNKELIPVLCRNLKEYRNKIHIYNMAVGNSIGHADFYISSEAYPASSSIREPTGVYQTWPEMNFTKDTCRITTLDYHNKMWLQAEVIDFIWADVQGAEIDLIQGGAETFKKVRYFYTEYSDIEFYKGEIGLKGILELLPDFEIVDRDGGNVLLKNKL